MTDRNFDADAFNEAVSKPNGWDSVPDPVAEIRRMRGEVPVGNTAKMRAALETIRDRMVAGVYDGRFDCHESIETAEAALAAPPRNCDRFATPGEIMSEFRRRQCKFCNGVEGVGGKNNCFRCFPEWIFAEATNEGGKA